MCVNERIGRRLGDRKGSGAVIYRHLQVHGHAKLFIRQLLDSYDLGDIFAVHGIVRGAEGEGHKHAHAFIVGIQARDEIDAVLGSVDADGQILEVVIAGFGRPYADRPGHFRPAAASFFWVLGGYGFFHCGILDGVLIHQ